MPEKKLTNHNHEKYITTLELNTLAAVFNARLVQAHLITKTNFNASLSSLHREIPANKSKHSLVENELKKLKTFDSSSSFIGKSHFEDGTQNYLVFQTYSSILNKLLVLVMAVTFITGNLKDCLMRKLIL